MIGAYPAQDVENEQLVEPVQVEADDIGSDDNGDLAVEENRYYGKIFFVTKVIKINSLYNIIYRSPKTSSLWGLSRRIWWIWR